jgi:SAM-dependent methyltransferase
MVMQVLKNKEDLSNSREMLNSKNVSHIDSHESLLIKVLRRLKFVNKIKVGDFVKSWDVLNTLLFIEKNLKAEDPILDIGCYASEIIIALHKNGFKNLTGADLNSSLNKMPFNKFIRYVNANFMKTDFPDNLFKAVTAISVIEHGFNPHALLKEMSRIVMPGGYFISSFDYWPQKIDTKDTKFFDMDWIIFSKQDVEDFVSLAATYNFFPVGEMSFDSETPLIHCANKEYTFGWLVLEKRI